MIRINIVLTMTLGCNIYEPLDMPYFVDYELMRNIMANPFSDG